MLQNDGASPSSQTNSPADRHDVMVQRTKKEKTRLRMGFSAGKRPVRWAKQAGAEVYGRWVRTTTKMPLAAHQPDAPARGKWLPRWRVGLVCRKRNRIRAVRWAG